MLPTASACREGSGLSTPTLSYMKVRGEALKLHAVLPKTTLPPLNRRGILCLCMQQQRFGRNRPNTCHACFCTACAAKAPVV